MKFNAIYDTRNSHDIICIMKISNLITGMNRPTMIHLAENNISHLSQSIFEPFFDEHELNVMNVDRNPFVCDCRLKWLVDKIIKSKQLMEKKLYGLTCQNKKSIWQLSPQDFINC
jgi:hypothetical protein